MKKLLSTAITVLSIQLCNSQTTTYEYFGQTPPGNIPEVFAHDFISLDNRGEAFITFSSDGKECYFTEHDVRWDTSWIMETVYSGGAWTVPKKASFISSQTINPNISPDGTKLFFSSSVEGNDLGVYQCTRTVSGWSVPVEIDRQISSRVYESSCRLSDKGNFFVCSWRSGGKGGCDGWRIPYVDGQYKKAENLGFLNSSDGDCHWAPGPNESYLIWNSRRPLNGSGSAFFETDLFISFAKPDGSWTYPRNLGPNINSAATEMGASISHDGKYLFFASDRRGSRGENDIYWVSTGFIDSLRNTNFPPYVKSPIPNQNARQDSLFNYQVPDSTFIDDDGNSTLHYTATLSDGSSLPAWLSFDSLLYVFSGTPDTATIFKIKVIATDTAGMNTSCLFNITVSGSPTGIEEKFSRFPDEFILYQNYPNPFDSETTIYFELKKPGNTRLTIYDLSGKKIETILHGYKQAGKHQIIWKGEGHRKGKYLCNLQVSEIKSGQQFFESTIQILLR